ncbi:MAG TPA: response regulator [Acidobacteriaceae bacterium]|nr:response regulator [Acidobacteriaceae bacterium]
MAFNVLIIDDSPAMRKFIRRVLALSGVEIGECLDAGDGQEALNILRANWVDIVLTDINMPNMNGEQFMEKMAGDPLLSSIPVLVVSTDRSDARMKRMLGLGAKDYLTKPFLPEQLGGVLGKVLGGRAHGAN